MITTTIIIENEITTMSSLVINSSSLAEAFGNGFRRLGGALCGTNMLNEAIICIAVSLLILVILPELRMINNTI
jgi:hypothetical protein